MGDMADDLLDHMFELMQYDEQEDMYDMSMYCSRCDSKMQTKIGKYGKFRGCSAFPECKKTEAWQSHGEIVDNRL